MKIKYKYKHERKKIKENEVLRRDSCLKNIRKQDERNSFI